MPETVLAIDIGNTRISAGLFKGDRLQKTLGLETRPLRERVFYEDALRGFVDKDRPSGGVLSSVVPSHTGLFAGLLERLTGEPPLVVSHSVNTGLHFDVPDPGGIGADRIANAVAAHDMLKGNLVVADLGTATTLTVVDREGRFLGGAIMPGVEMMCRALSEGTGKLPLAVPAHCPGPLGKETKSSIITGSLYGTAGAIERLVDEFSLLLEEPETLLTGGHAPLIKDLLRRKYSHVPDLTLTGLRIIFEKNRG